MNIMIFAEEQVDDLQNQIRKLQEQIITLKYENTDLKNELKNNEITNAHQEFIIKAHEPKETAGETTFQVNKFMDDSYFGLRILVLHLKCNDILFHNDLTL